jgi:hypothetical protein
MSRCGVTRWPRSRSAVPRLLSIVVAFTGSPA